MKQQIAKLIGLALIVTAATSCGHAKKTDLDQLRAELGEVRNTALAAQSVANDAKVTADHSLEMSKRTEEIVNRSFKHSMRK